MRHLKSFENFDHGMMGMHNQPSAEEMMDYLCACGYNEMDVMDMDEQELAHEYEVCRMQSNESRRYGRRYESFDRNMMNMQGHPSEEEMMDYLCACGYNEMDVMEMDAHELAHEYEVCRMEMNEARKSKSTNYKKSGLKNPGKADLNKDKKISGYEKARGKAVQKSMEEQDKKGKGSRTQKEEESKSNGKLSAAQKNKLHPALQKAIANKRK